MALFKEDLRQRSAQELCVIFGEEFVRVVCAIVWALDDRQRPQREIQKEALALLGEAPADIKERIARCSGEVLAQNVVMGREIVVKVANELLRRMTPGAVAWWKTLAPSPTWLPGAPGSPEEEALPALRKALKIERLMDFTSDEPDDLQGDAVENVGKEYRRQRSGLRRGYQPTST